MLVFFWVRTTNFMKIQVICPTLNVMGAAYADCNGNYKVTGESVSWSPDRLVYKHINKVHPLRTRYIWMGYYGWSIGPSLKSPGWFYKSKFNVYTNIGMCCIKIKY